MNCFSVRSFVAIVALLTLFHVASADDTDWVSLFDGKSLSGWQKVGEEGHFAFQQHDPGSSVSIRKVEVMAIK